MSEEVEKMETKEVKPKTSKWIHHGIFGGMLLILVAWASFNWKLTDESLDHTCRVVNVAAESATFGYLSARQAELVPEKVKEVVDVIGDALVEASSKIEAEKLDLNNFKVEIANIVNKFIDEKLDGNTLYKTLADILINAGINAATTYINDVKETKASDFVAIVASMRAGILTGAAPFVN